MADVGYGVVRASTAAVVRHGDRILLGRRNKPGAFGKWVLPGGAMDFLEPMKDALKRELKEETGIDIEVKDFIGVYEIIAPELKIHKVISYYWADYVSGEIVATDDISEARFFTKDEVKQIVESGETTDTIKKVLSDIGWY